MSDFRKCCMLIKLCFYPSILKALTLEQKKKLKLSKKKYILNKHSNILHKSKINSQCLMFNNSGGKCCISIYVGQCSEKCNDLAKLR